MQILTRDQNGRFTKDINPIHKLERMSNYEWVCLLVGLAVMEFIASVFYFLGRKGCL